MDTNFGLTLEQKQLLSQTQIQSLELLNMCNVELNSFLNNEYMENPLLEQSGDSNMPGITEDFHSWYDRRQTFNEGYGDSDKNESKFREGTPAVYHKEIERYLKDQLDAKKYTKKEWEVIEFLIMNLDDSGFYSASLEETARGANAPVDMVQKCLEDLRQLEPYGIFAENLSACLLRQLDVLGVEEENLRAVISRHLEHASQGKISSITRDLKISSAAARKYIAFIGTLNPRPLSGFDSGRNSYVIPDILFTRKGSSWDIALNDNWMGNYQLNEYYLKMIAESKDEELQNYFRKKLERARFILSSIEQRRKTILTISGAILEWQRDFFEKNAQLVPMTMSDLAQKLDIHPSTVSRAVNGKYIQYPGGTLLMKDMFSPAVSGDDKESAMTAAQIKKVLKTLIDEEDKKKPCSDQILSNLLKEKGITLSRRAVAKYREELGIRGSFERKEI